MDAQTLYPVCPDRNVAAAYQCFFGPDSRGLERFFASEGVHWANDALFIVRHKGAQVFSKAIAEFNPALTWWWVTTSAALPGFVHYLATSTMVCSRFLLYHVMAAALRSALPNLDPLPSRALSDTRSGFAVAARVAAG
jgi:hypothetical protein